VKRIAFCVASTDFFVPVFMASGKVHVVIEMNNSQAAKSMILSKVPNTSFMSFTVKHGRYPSKRLNAHFVPSDQ
jgi:hypothetical protein